MNIVAYYSVNNDELARINVEYNDDTTLSEVADEVMRTANVLTRHVRATIGTQSLSDVPLTMKVLDYINQYGRVITIRWDLSYMREVAIQVISSGETIVNSTIDVDSDTILTNIRQVIIDRYELGNSRERTIKVTDSNDENPANGITKIRDVIPPIIFTVSPSNYVTIPVLVRWKNVNDTYNYRLNVNSSIEQLSNMIRNHYSIGDDYNIDIISNSSSSRDNPNHNPSSSVKDLVDEWVVGVIRAIDSRDETSYIQSTLSGTITYNGRTARFYTPFLMSVDIQRDTGNDILDRLMSWYPLDYTNSIIVIANGRRLEDLNELVSSSGVNRHTILTFIVTPSDSKETEFYQRVNVILNNQERDYRINVRESLAVLVNQLARDNNIGLNRYNIKLRLINPITGKTTYLYHDKSGSEYHINNGRTIIATVVPIGSRDDNSNPNYSVDSYHLGRCYNESDIDDHITHYYDFTNPNVKMIRLVERLNATLPIRRFVEYIGNLMNIEDPNELTVSNSDYNQQLDQDQPFSIYKRHRSRHSNSIIYRGIPSPNNAYIPIKFHSEIRLFSVDMNQPLIKLINEIKLAFNINPDNIVLGYSTSIIDKYKFGREYNLIGLDGIIVTDGVGENRGGGSFSIKNKNGNINVHSIEGEVPLAYELDRYTLEDRDYQFLLTNIDEIIDVTKTYRELNMTNNSIIEVISSTPATNTLVSNIINVKYNGQNHTIDMNRPIREFVDKIRESEGITNEITIRDNDEVLDKNLPAYIYPSIEVIGQLYGEVEPIKEVNSMINVNVVDLIGRYNTTYDVNIDDTIGDILNARGYNNAVMINNGVILDRNQTVRYYRLDNIGTIYIAQ